MLLYLLKQLCHQHGIFAAGDADGNAVAFLHQLILVDGFREFAENVLVEFLAQALFHGIADFVCLLLFDLGHEPGNVAAL